MRCDMGDCQSDATWRYSWPPNIRTVCDAHMQTAMNEARKVGRVLPRGPIDADYEPEPVSDAEEVETKAHQIARLAATKGLVEHDLKRKAPRPL